MVLGQVAGAAIGVGAGILGGAIQGGTAKEMQERAIQVNREEAHLNRMFQRDEGTVQRQYAAGEASKARDWSSREARGQRIYNTREAIAARQFSKEMFGEEMSFNQAQAEANRRFQAEQAIAQREFSERMSSTSYQRAMDDLRSAGLNPMLAYKQGGASTPNVGLPSGSAASAGGPSGVAARASVPGSSTGRSGSYPSGAQARVKAATMGSQIMKEAMFRSAGSAVELRRLKKDVEKAEEEKKLIKEQAIYQRRMQEFAKANTAKTLADMKLSLNSSIMKELEMPARKVEADYREKKAKSKMRMDAVYRWADVLSDLFPVLGRFNLGN